MTTVLAIHIGPELAHAAVDRDGRIDLVAAGDDSAGMPVVVHMAVDGSIGVGAAAPDTGGDDLAGEDFLAQLADTGMVRFGVRTLSGELVLAHLLAQVHARCVRVLDGLPDRVVLVLTAGGPTEAVYAAAARRALIGEVTLVDETRAWAALAAHGPRGLHPDLAGALGALFLQRHGEVPTGPLPIVTREDLGESEKEPMRPPPGPSVISVGARSVFDETTRVAIPRRRRLPVVLLALAGALVIGIFALVLLVDRDQAPYPPPSPALPTTLPPTTLPPEETTTTLPPLGPVTLAENGLLLRATTQNQTLIGFGTDATTALDALAGVLGGLTADTGWGVDEICTSGVVRRVQLGDLEVVFTDAEELDGVVGTGATFTQWFVWGADASRSALWTLNRIGIGSTVADLTETYPDEFTLDQALPDSNDPAGYLRIDPFRLGALIEGMTSNTTAGGRVLQLWSGDGCQRAFVG
ncbi:MAG: hypothetical protein MK191_07715 [Acidimicrobiales bacterium]|nr:hypothetical protein [Acidimicrobiales bacterium]